MSKWKYIPDFGTQQEWNQTLVTALNVVCLSKGVEKEPIKVRVPDKFRPIIESIAFYDKDSKFIKNLYEVEFFPSRYSAIYVEAHPLEIVGYNGQ